MRSTLLRLHVRSVALVALVTIGLTIPYAATGSAATNGDPTEGSPTADGERLARLVKPWRAYQHLMMLQLAADVGGGNRTPGSRGLELSQRYVSRTLTAAGYDVRDQEFSYLYTQDLDARYQVPATGSEEKIKTINFTPSTPVDGLEADVVPLPTDVAEGCAPNDFEGLGVEDSIVLIKRGTCTFGQKQRLAGAAGAIGALIYNNEPGLLYGSLDSPDQGVIPCGAMTREQGEDLIRAAQDGTLRIRMFVRQLVEERETSNLFAETKGGDPDNVLMVGAHLDSVPEGPGINDNGSGSAATLELALAMAGHAKEHSARVRFAWWSAEEWGQIGSQHYVESLSAEQRNRIKGYIDLAKLGSPNYVRAYLDATDEDGSGGPVGPPGSERLQTALAEGLTRDGEPALPLDLNGARYSDWLPFFYSDIPVGGLFSGSAEGIKTPEEEKLFGGEAGRPYDSCQHLPCDRVSNINQNIFAENLDAAAYAVGYLASPHGLSSR